METRIDNSNFINQQKGQKEIDWWERNDQKLITLEEAGESYRLIYTLRSGKEPKEAKPQVLVAIEEAGKRWRKKLEEKEIGIPPENLYLSITSLLRSKELQEKLTEKNPNANSKSSHTLGAAADIDANGFYLLKEDGEFEPINARNTPEELLENLRKTLFKTLLEMEKEGLISFIPEYMTRENKKISTMSCFHICPNLEIGKMLENK